MFPKSVMKWPDFYQWISLSPRMYIFFLCICSPQFEVFHLVWGHTYSIFQLGKNVWLSLLGVDISVVSVCCLVRYMHMAGSTFPLAGWCDLDAGDSSLALLLIMPRNSRILGILQTWTHQHRYESPREGWSVLWVRDIDSLSTLKR